MLTLIEPGVAVATTTGFGYRPNSSWVTAQYEIAFLFGKSPFARLVPTYQRVPGWDFPAQIANGGLDFKILSDADCNFWEDFGQHRYEIGSGLPADSPSCGLRHHVQAPSSHSGFVDDGSYLLRASYLRPLEGRVAIATRPFCIVV